MKTIFTLLASTLFSASVFAADIRPSGSVTIKSSENSRISVVMDGKRFEPNSNAIVISGLTEGLHNVQVYRQRSSGSFSMRSGRTEVIYTGSLNVKKRTSLSVTISSNGRAVLKETRMIANPRNSGNEFDYGSGAQWGGNDNGGQWDDYGNSEAYNSGMSSRDFDRILQTIDKEWLEGNKLKSATQVVRANSLSVAQVSELVRLFTFENNKLELAKQAYQNTVDKRNYYLISDLLTFNANKADLEKYIRNYR